MNYDKSASFLAAQLRLKITHLKRRIKKINGNFKLKCNTDLTLSPL
jgi:hypothetical protein